MKSIFFLITWGAHGYSVPCYTCDSFTVLYWLLVMRERFILTVCKFLVLYMLKFTSEQNDQ